MSKIVQGLQKAASGINTIHGSKLAQPTGLMGTFGSRRVGPEEGAPDASKPAESTLVGSVGAAVVMAPDNGPYYDGSKWPPNPPSEAEMALAPWLGGQHWSRKPQPEPVKGKGKASSDPQIL